MGKRVGIGIGVGLLLFCLLYQAKQQAAVQAALIPGEIDVVYFNQADEAWGSKYYDTKETESTDHSLRRLRSHLPGYRI